jgi:hypothetical protein
MRLPLSALLLWLVSCASTQVFRLNPGEDPERYRIVCRDSSRHCDRQARETCDGEYTVLKREMSRPEQEEVQDSDLSSTGPSEGLVGWRSEIVVICGHDLPALRLVRPEEDAAPAETTTTVPSSAPSSQASAMQERVCIPGETQACLGPGACSGAQACLRDGSGYGICDCGFGAGPPSPGTAPTASASPTAHPGAPGRAAPQ